MKYSQSHEWVKIDDDIATIGISDHAQGELGEIVYVELPEVGNFIHLGEEAVVLESTKAAADVYTPLSGEVVEVNTVLLDASEMINASPEENGWLFKIKFTQAEELNTLMDSESYKSFIS